MKQFAIIALGVAAGIALAGLGYKALNQKRKLELLIEQQTTINRNLESIRRAEEELSRMK